MEFKVTSVLVRGNERNYFSAVGTPRGCAASRLGNEAGAKEGGLAAMVRGFSDVTHTLQRPDRESVSGVYIVNDRRLQLPRAVFKPRDEEMDEEADPLLSQFHSGSGSYREMAASLLDSDKFAGVPETKMACLPVVGVMKEGALQAFVPNVGDVDDFGPALFQLEDVQRVAAFDLRTLNADRHGGNLLVARTDAGHRLHPIDHGMILPDSARSLPWPVWMNWSQAKKPLTEDVKEYIRGLDADRDIRMLRANLGDELSEGAMDALRCGTALLQIGASLGMSLFEIGRLVYCADLNETSVLESLLKDGASLELRSLPNSTFVDAERCAVILHRACSQHPELTRLLSPALRIPAEKTLAA